MRALGQNPTNKEVKYLIGQVGSLSGGTMEFGAFLRMMAAHMEEFTDDEGDAVAAFKAYDREQTGFMSVAELRHLTTKMGQEAVSEEDFDSMLAEVGIDPDGQVDYVAFVQAMCK
jgi:Ca2+-binding EF-hand superfamily protein